MSLSSENTVMTMPVTPAYQNGGYGILCGAAIGPLGLSCS